MPVEIVSKPLGLQSQEMVDAKEFDAKNAVASQSKGHRSETCISTCKCACIIPPKCGPGPCKNITADKIKG